MRTPATTQFLAAVDPFRKIIKVAKKNRFSLASHARYGPKARTTLAILRKNFLVMKRDYPDERYPRVAFQIASIEPLIVNLTETFPNDPQSMLQLTAVQISRSRGAEVVEVGAFSSLGEELRVEVGILLSKLGDPGKRDLLRDVVELGRGGVH